MEALELMEVATLAADHVGHGGHTVAERVFGDCELREVLLVADTVLPTHVHAHGSITLLVQGSYEEMYPSGHATASCRAPSVVIKSPGRSHAERIGPEGAHVLSVSIREPLWKAWAASDERVDGPVHFESGECLLVAERIFSEFKDPGPGSDLIVSGLLSQLVGSCISAAARNGSVRPYPWLDDVRDYASKEFRNPLTVKSLAARAGVHPDYLSRRFRGHYGMSLVRYIRRLRLRWASEQLQKNELALGQITRAAGFSDQSHFTRSFKQSFGITPGQYRRARRSKNGTNGTNGAGGLGIQATSVTASRF
jgi:AraC family transcriptional regulator